MLSLTVEPREELKSKAEKLREKKVLPAVVYGKDLKNMPIKTVYNDFIETYERAGESTIIKLKVKGKEEKEYPVLIRDVQKDPVSGAFLHADFFQLPMNEKVEVTIPIEFEGESPAEKELGAILIKNIQEIDIKALPKDLIHSVVVDVSSLTDFDQEIKIKDLTIPKEVEVLADSDEIVAVVGRVKEEEMEEEPSEEEKLEDIEVVGEKEEGEGEEGGGGEEEEGEKKTKGEKAKEKESQKDGKDKKEQEEKKK